jgi:valyl-tRNA synthetase
VLDTWFSSGLLPLSAFNWPNNSGELEKHFPLSLMETGHDILFFWVARMVMLSIELTGKVPFNQVLLHGILCDAHGRKMSKSLGNVILPTQIIDGITLNELHDETRSSVAKGIISETELEKSLEGQRKMFPNGIQECGVDALRFTLCSQNIKQHFVNFDINECVTNKLFFNKIWQATKYTINFADQHKVRIKEIKNLNNLKLSLIDKWILSRLSNTIATVRQSIENYNFHLATAALKTFFYNNLCDVYVETTKMHLQKFDSNDKALATSHVLCLCIAEGLKYISCFTPYLYQELSNYLPQNYDMNVESFTDNELEKKIDEMLDACSKVRELKAHLKIGKKTKSSIKILITSPNYENFMQSRLNEIKLLTFSSDIEIINNLKAFESMKFTAKSTANHFCTIGINVLEDSEKYKNADASLNSKKLAKHMHDLENLIQVTSNKGYKEKADAKVQAKHKEKVKLISQF